MPIENSINPLARGFVANVSNIDPVSIHEAVYFSSQLVSFSFSYGRALCLPPTGGDRGEVVAISTAAASSATVRGRNDIHLFSFLFP